MKKFVSVDKKIRAFNKKISVTADKSLSIRWAILASLALGKSKSYNILKSEDVLSVLSCLKKLGLKVKLKKNSCEIVGKGINGYTYRKGVILNAGNSGTAARLLSGVLINSPEFIKITGDTSLNKRDMTRIIVPLKSFGAKFKKNHGTLPLTLKGTKHVNPIYYEELLGSAQCKSTVMLASLFANGWTKLKCKKSRSHTELLFKHLKIPIKIKKTKNFDFIDIKGCQNFKAFSYKIPGDISSAAFLIVLTLLSKNSKLTIKNVNVNKTRTGILDILNMMGAGIILKNKKTYNGEEIADIFIKSKKNLKSIKCKKEFNSRAIDEMLLIFFVSSLSNGISTFHGLQELNKKESKRLDWGYKILKMIGVKVQKISNHGIKVFGNPNLELKENYEIKDYLKDHRIYMLSTIIALTVGGNWKIHDPDSIKTSFPSFNKLIKSLGGKIN